jgi:anti-sigma factor ChrR (cupin superfamily)
METEKLENMIKGWFVGGFSPSAHKTDACEVAVKRYSQGDFEPSHYHKIATEITLVLTGKVRMNGREWGEGDIIVINPGDATDFEALSDVVNVVVKVPGAADDKYLT